MQLKLNNRYVNSYIFLLIVFIFIVPLFLFKPFVDLNYSSYTGYDDAFENANSVYKMLITIVFILLAVIIFNVNNLNKIKIKKKLFILNILPLILVLIFYIIFLIDILLDYQSFQKEFFIMNPPCETTGPCGAPVDLKQAIYNLISFILYYLSIYYIIMFLYGIYYFKKVNNVLGFRIIILNLSILISILLNFLIINLFYKYF